MPNAIFVRGIPGSGKSTYVRNNYPGILHLEADMLCMKGGVYNFDENKLGKNHQTIEDIFRTVIDLGADVVVSNTFIKQWELNKYIDYLIDTDYNIKVIRMTKEYESIHHIPEDILTRMKNTIEDWPGEVFV